MKPERTELVTIKKCEQLQNRLLIAIDGGTEFTKVFFLNKRNKEQLFNNKEASLGLELSVFHSPDFEYAINWLRDNAYIPEDKSYRVHVTGYCTIQQQNKIKSILKRDVLYIDEFLSMAMGCKFALEYIGVDNLLAKPSEVEPYVTMESDMLGKMMDAYNNKLATRKCVTDGMHPCMFFVQGTNSGFYYFDEKGSCEYFRSAISGIPTLRGYSKCLANTNNLDELFSRASTGSLLSSDTTTYDVLDDAIDSPYGHFPLIPVFSFGKCGDKNFGLEVLRKEDIALSVVTNHIQNILTYGTYLARSRITPKVYICGGIFESELFKRELKMSMSMPLITIRASILNFDYSAILGILVCEGNCVGSYKISPINIF